jgi:two-component system chemotaxis sensor kinase CheA
MSDDLLPYFLEEGRELTERAGEALLDLERGHDTAEALERAFRAVHTLKGSAALFDMAELGALLHAAESELELARAQGGALSPAQLYAHGASIGETERWIEVLEAQGSVPPARRQAAAALEAGMRAAGRDSSPAAEAPGPAPSGGKEASRSSRTVRVEAASLDMAADLLDQLVIAKNALAHETALALGHGAARADGVARAQLALDRAVAALQGAVGQMRLAPLRRLFAPLPRQVREMADALGKQVELRASGEDVALDKAIMDGLYEPLIHVLRNAVDHGVEAPAARTAAGKPARGLIRLAAVPRGDVAVIEVSDDGAGLDLGRIRAVAVARELVSAEAAAALNDSQAADLVFTPGFSTAAAVTDLSGRGVGLDAVRTALARIGGRVEVESRAGQGTVVRMTAPLRTLVTRVAVVEVEGERYAAPLDMIREVVRVPRAEVTAVRSGEAVVVRDEVVPLLHLGALLGGKPSRADPLTVIVVEAAGEHVGVAVDRMAETLQSPVQAASPLLAGLTGVTGSILQGDGRILLVLDLVALTS